MKEERILNALGQVEESYIEEAAPKNMSAPKQNGNKKYTWVKWGALAACLCIIAGISIKSALFSKPDRPASDILTGFTSDNTTTIDTAITTTDNQSVSTTVENQAVTESLPLPEENVDYNTVIEPGDEGFPNWGLTLSVKNVTATGLTLVVTQSGGAPTGELQTGEPYRLIALIDGTWKTVEELPLPEGVDGRAWNSLAYWIPMEDSREFEVNWEWIFGELPAGTYRFIKGFMDFRGTANYDTFEYWVEFEIQ